MYEEYPDNRLFYIKIPGSAFNLKNEGWTSFWITNVESILSYNDTEVYFKPYENYPTPLYPGYYNEYDMDDYIFLLYIKYNGSFIDNQYITINITSTSKDDGGDNYGKYYNSTISITLHRQGVT